MNSFILLTAVVGAGLLLLPKLFAANAVTRFKFSIAGIDFYYAGLVPVLSLSVSIFNPTNTTVTINRADGDIYLNGEFVSTASNLQRVSIPAQQEQVYRINFELNFSNIVKEFINILVGGSNKTANIRFVGEVEIENTTIPLDVSYKLIPG